MYYSTYYYNAQTSTPSPATGLLSLADLYKQTIELFATPEVAPVVQTSFPRKSTSINETIQEPAFKVFENIKRIEAFVEKNKHWLDTDDMHQYYDVFQIPKASGGFRTIKAPKEPLKSVQYEAKELLEKMGLLEHDAAFAYVKERSTYHALAEHQRNESKWFLKLDVKNFFDNCTTQLMIEQLLKLQPVAAVHERTRTVNTLSLALEIIGKINTLDGGFPQGTPLSPCLTNLIMVPFDYHVSRKLRSLGFVYTRYADDILISHKKAFRFTDTTAVVQITFEQNRYPFQLNRDKTRYGSSAGSNWNLGLMLNKKNEITIGHKRKKNLKAMLHQFMMDRTAFDKEATQVMLGQLEYYRSHEPQAFENFMAHTTRKYHLTVPLYDFIMEHLKSFN